MRARMGAVSNHAGLLIDEKHTKAEERLGSRTAKGMDAKRGEFMLSGLGQKVT